MVHFSKLKLYGFKSFVDKTEIDIAPGMNGIVGPNGCGKSNLVEALRWVMGEKSAKTMRGDGMEDVIFAGTAKRPARNMAEVSVIIDNTDKQAPAPFNTATEIEINRRIEKDKGSQYRVNGKSVRARDVHLLFADTMTGANSPALVSQGRITEIVVAKPQDRRRILEESAGITGLHSRRHEAELRLRAAEQNLTRLDDVIKSVKGQLGTLKRQARQAESYKELSETIRQMDMAIDWREWTQARTAIKEGRADFETQNNAVQQSLQIKTDLESILTQQEDKLSTARQNETESRAVMQNLQITLERLEMDIESRSKGLKDAENTLADLDRDIAYTHNRQMALNEEKQTIQSDQEAAQHEINDLPSMLTKSKQELEEAQTVFDSLQQSIQDIKTQKAIANEQIKQTQTQRDNLENRLSRTQQQVTTLQNTIEQLETDLKQARTNDALSFDLESFETKIYEAEKQHQSSLIDKKNAEDFYQNAQNALQDSQALLKTYEAESQALKNLLSSHQSETSSDHDLLLDHLDITEGYEKAVVATLGYGLALKAGTDSNAAVYWDKSDITVNTPANTQKLSDFLTVPSSLTALMNAVGLVDNFDTAPSLTAGQMLVTKNGDIKRWDGLMIKADQAQEDDRASIILVQKNRLQALSTLINEQKQDVEHKETTLINAKDTLEKSNQLTQDCLQRVSETKNKAIECRHAHEKAHDHVTHLEKQYDDSIEQMGTLNTDYNDLKKQYDALPSEDGRQNSIEKIQEELVNFQDQYAQAQSNLENKRETVASITQKDNILRSSADRLSERLEKITQEQSSLEKRLTELDTRHKILCDKIIHYKDQEDSEIDNNAKRENLLTQIAAHKEQLDQKIDAVQIQESEYKQTQNTLRNAESDSATAREKRATAQSQVNHYAQELTRIETHIDHTHSMSPQSLEQHVMTHCEGELPDTNTLQIQRDQAYEKRERIGPVNLRADIEAQETEEQLAQMEAENNDLTEAISQLRNGIAKLNREARERLAVAFTRVDQHFQTLFSQLFEGGKAHLKMIESDDPLQAGLEIYAQPPGKSLQALSLLSGGEQTLTAIALIFAMFMTNPSPICVLDEIDAPLDDANVDRVCTLMESIVRETQTRFIVITHHRMTMARMDRLYGVTMGEKGVSQLVSVDLAMQAELSLTETETA